MLRRAHREVHGASTNTTSTTGAVVGIVLGGSRTVESGEHDFNHQRGGQRRVGREIGLSKPVSTTSTTSVVVRVVWSVETDDQRRARLAAPAHFTDNAGRGNTGGLP